MRKEVRINQCLRLLSRQYRRDFNSVRINTHNSYEHELSKFKLAYELIKDGKKILTEAIFNNGSRADILIPESFTCIEIMHSEKLDRAIEKTRKYPKELNIVYKTTEEILNNNQCRCKMKVTFTFSDKIKKYLKDKNVKKELDFDVLRGISIGSDTIFINLSAQQFKTDRAIDELGKTIVHETLHCILNSIVGKELTKYLDGEERVVKILSNQMQVKKQEKNRKKAKNI